MSDIPLYSREFTAPVTDGSITIPDTLDFHLKHNPEHNIYVYQRDGSTEETSVSLLEFARACNRVARLLGPRFTSGSKDSSGALKRPVVAFMALTDSLVYQAVFIGLMRAGVVPFPISPRNTAAAVVNLLRKTDCHYLVTTSTTLGELVKSVKADLTSANSNPDTDYAFEVIEVPGLDEIYPYLGAEKHEDDPTEYVGPYPRRTREDLAAYIHSSGSTGFPKAIPQSHAVLTNWASFPVGRVFRDHNPRLRIAAMHLPPFHTLGILAQVIFTLYSGTTVGLYPPTVTSPDALPLMPTPENILDHLRRTRSNAIITIPTLLQIWAQDVKSVETLSKLEFVSYSGGAVPAKLGNFMVDSGVKLNPGYGATEFGSPTWPYKRKGDEADWAYMEFCPRAKIRWVPQGDGTHECQFLTCDTHPLPVENLPDVPGYATADLFEQHPTKPYLWKIVGRLDDVIVHTSGEKTVPAPMEDVVMSSTHIMGTVMFGQTHDQPGIIIEPKAAYAIDVNNEREVAHFRNLIWPIIEEANKVAPTFSRIFKEMILVTSKDKPLPRAGKGTVMRKAALQVYHDEIEALYASVESTQAAESIEPPQTWDVDAVKTWLSQQVKELNQGKEIGSSDDVFEQGFDSLSATILRRRIAGALLTNKSSSAQAALDSITQNTVYTYPTLDLLSEYLVRLVNAPATASDGEPTSIISARVDAIEKMIAKYSVSSDTSDVSMLDASRHDQPKTVLLTGSTGNLGSQILESLLKDDRVKRVYALNRTAGSKTIAERHQERFSDKALDSQVLSSEKLVYVQADLAKNGLGVTEELHNELRDSVNVIIHTAWRLDFNLSLASFDSSIHGTRNLVDLARSSKESPRFIFTSSVASALSWDKSLGAYPEEVLANAQYAVGQGYGESKYVTERVLQKSGLDATSLRIGQISGGKPNGAWAISDWVPILVKSGLALGALPLATGLVSWTPMDVVSSSILDLVFTSNGSLPPAMNITHPKPAQWSTVIQYIATAVQHERNLSSPLKLVSFEEWFGLLEKQATSSSETLLERIPAVKLRDFFAQMTNAEKAHIGVDPSTFEAGGMTIFSTSKMQSLSPTLNNLQPLTYDDVALWVKYWNAKAYFD